MIVLNQIRSPMVSIPEQEAVVALEPEPQRPIIKWPCIGSFVAGDEMPFSTCSRRPPSIIEMPSNRCGTGRNTRRVSRVVQGDISDKTHSNAMGISAGQEGRSRG